MTQRNTKTKTSEKFSTSWLWLIKTCPEQLNTATSGHMCSKNKGLWDTRTVTKSGLLTSVTIGKHEMTGGPYSPKYESPEIHHCSLEHNLYLPYRMEPSWKIQKKSSQIRRIFKKNESLTFKSTRTWANPGDQEASQRFVQKNGQLSLLVEVDKTFLKFPLLSQIFFSSGGFQEVSGQNGRYYLSVVISGSQHQGVDFLPLILGHL